MEACMVPLRPQSLTEWAGTDAAWWRELAAARGAWQEGREMIAGTRKAIDQATAHMRTKHG